MKELIDDSPVFRKLKEDEFYKLVTSLTNINETSKAYYMNQWSFAGEPNTNPVVPLREVFTKSFSLIMNSHDIISTDEKIFVIKIARCYITEAVEASQTFKYPVDKWNSDYLDSEAPENIELAIRQR